MEEMKKLMAMLDAANIPYKVEPHHLDTNGMKLTAYFDEAMTNEMDDCVYFRGSYGYDEGLLESYRARECDGYETAQDIFDIWEYWYKAALE